MVNDLNKLLTLLLLTLNSKYYALQSNLSSKKKKKNAADLNDTTCWGDVWNPLLQNQLK